MQFCAALGLRRAALCCVLESMTVCQCKAVHMAQWHHRLHSATLDTDHCRLVLNALVCMQRRYMESVIQALQEVRIDCGEGGPMRQIVAMDCAVV